MDMIWRYDARQNVFWMGWVPVFYWPRLTGETDDLEAPLRQIGFRTNNYFGQQVLSDWNGFKIFGLRRPDWIDNWNVDLDYLSARTKDFPALGSEMGWFGRDLIRDLTDPYHKIRTPGEHITYDYFGYFDIWGLKDEGIDVLGSGPAIVTNGPAGAGKKGYQRSDVPPFQEIRGRFNTRHMQRFLPDDDEHRFEDLRLQLEVAYVSDRHFLEEYYKRLNETGLDQETLPTAVSEEQHRRGPSGPRPTFRTSTPTPSGCPGLTTTAWAIRWPTTGSTTISTRGPTTPAPTPTSWSTTPICSHTCPMIRSRTPAACSRRFGPTPTTRSTCR